MDDTLNNNSATEDVAAPQTDSGAPQAEAQSAPEPTPAPTPVPAPAPASAPAPAENRPTRQPSMAQVMESDEFAAYMSGAESVQRGALLTGKVVRQEDNGSVLVDIGAKSEGIIPRNEIGEDEINIGDDVEVVVIKTEDDEGHPILSKRRADYERTWRDLAESRDKQTTLQGTVRESVKGGLIVDLGVSAFVPASQVDIRHRSDLSRLVGRVIPVRVMEIDRKKNKVIASHRAAAEEDRKAREDEAWKTLQKDSIVEGTVRRITDFGAFVDIGGIDGLLHVREMAWNRVEHPSQVVKKGQKLQVLVLEMDEERKRVALGLKQLLPDPWKKAAKNYRIGQTVTGKIIRTAPAFAFIELEPGVEGTIPISELSEERIKTVEDAVKVGQEVEARIKQIQTNQRRITLSLRAAVQENERRETRTAVREVNERASDDGPLRLGDLFGKELRAARDRGKERNKSRDEARARAEEAAEDEEDDLDLDYTDTEVDSETDDLMDEENGTSFEAGTEAATDDVATSAPEAEVVPETEAPSEAEAPAEVESEAPADAVADAPAATEEAPADIAEGEPDAPKTEGGNEPVE